jgi:hypothetical protein
MLERHSLNRATAVSIDVAAAATDDSGSDGNASRESVNVTSAMTGENNGCQLTMRLGNLYSGSGGDGDGGSGGGGGNGGIGGSSGGEGRDTGGAASVVTAATAAAAAAASRHAWLHAGHIVDSGHSDVDANAINNTATGASVGSSGVVDVASNRNTNMRRVSIAALADEIHRARAFLQGVVRAMKAK